ncbi:MAG: thermonuclease family protein [Acidiferrobacterales bacterium]
MNQPISTKLPNIRASFQGALFLLPLVIISLVNSQAIASQSVNTSPAIAQAVTVTKVIDGDTVILADGRHVRLIGINTPETGKKGRPAQPLAQQAKKTLQTLLRTGGVTLTLGKQPRDHYSRTLAYLDVDGIDVQAALLGAGMGWLVAIPPNIGRLKTQQAQQKKARKQDRGVWAEPYYQAKKATKLTGKNTGFQRVRGRIQSIGRSRKNVYFNFGPGFAARISKKNWQKYFPDSEEVFRNKVVIISGWISKQHGGKSGEKKTEKLFMSLGHPAMIEIVK